MYPDMKVYPVIKQETEKTHNSRTTIRIVFTVILWLTCLACFLALSWAQMDKFISKQTGISITDTAVLNGEREFPTLVFCSRRPFTKLTSANNTQAEFEEAINPNFTVTYKGIMESDYVYQPDVEFEHSHLISLYHGKCDVFKIKHPARVREYIVFHWSLQEDLLFYTFQPGMYSVGEQKCRVNLEVHNF